MGEFTIGEVSQRTGVATSALRFYETEGLIDSDRTESGHRRYPRSVIRRVSFIRVAQEVGLSLAEIREAMEALPDGTPSKKDWARLSRSWRPRLDEQIAVLERLRDRLDDCIGCGCLSLQRCSIINTDDHLAAYGTGPRRILAND